MADANKTLGELFRDLRRERKMTQASAAQRIGSAQSQISAFERGRENVLSHEKIEALAHLYDVDLTTMLSAAAQLEPTARYCSSRECPTNMPFVFGELIRFRPTVVQTNESYCRMCGEPLVPECPHCNAPLQPGLNCSRCGHEYVEGISASSVVGDPEEWARHQRQRNAEITSVVAPAVPRNENSNSTV